MRIFWREKPLTPDELALLSALFEAHHKAAFRQNPSGVAIVCATRGSGSYWSAMIAALSTFGKVHGPIVATYRLLSLDTVASAAEMVADGQLVPGWGNGFVKGKPDPDWADVDAKLLKAKPVLHEVIADVTRTLHIAGKLVFPNPSAYTAATALTLSMPEELSPYLLVAARMDAWAEIFNNVMKGD